MGFNSGFKGLKKWDGRVWTGLTFKQPGSLYHLNRKR
jgi:hypothetical protein